MTKGGFIIRNETSCATLNPFLCATEKEMLDEAGNTLNRLPVYHGANGAPMGDLEQPVTLIGRCTIQGVITHMNNKSMQTLYRQAPSGPAGSKPEVTCCKATAPTTASLSPQHYTEEPP